MLTIQTSALQKQLADLKKQIKVKLENMVRGFSYDITEEAIDNTPFNFDGVNGMYFASQRLSILGSPEVGKAKGGWTVGINRIIAIRNPVAAQDAGAGNTKMAAQMDLANYKLGDTIYITNKTPHVVKDGFPFESYKSGKPVKSLENGGSKQAPDGIMKPTLSTIQGVYSIKLADYYKFTE